MQHRIFLSLNTLVIAAASCIFSPSIFAAEPAELRVLAHSSFSIPKPLLAEFEKNNNIKVRINKAGDAGEMLNKLILTKANPIADVVFGIDNTLAPKAIAAQVLESTNLTSTSNGIQLPIPLLAVDYGYITINYDKAWFSKNAMQPPKSLEDLALPQFAALLVVQNPATSSTGNAFMLATIGALGEQKAFEWWARMRAGGVGVSKGWSEAYYTNFSRNGGKFPMVVSYASSPAAEVFYAKDKLTTPPTGSLSMVGAVFRQVEGVALVKGGGQRVAAEKFIEFLRSAAFQQQMQTEMWMYPIDNRSARADVMQFAPEPGLFNAPSDGDLASKGAEWVSRWNKVVIK